MISHLISQYHRIAIFKCNKNIQNSAWNADFFVFYFYSKLYHKNIFFVKSNSPNTFSSAKNTISAVQLTFRHDAIHFLMDSQFLLNSKGR